MSRSLPIENAGFPIDGDITREAVQSHQRMLNLAGSIVLQSLESMFPELSTSSGVVYAVRSDMPPQSAPDKYVPPHTRQAEQLQQAY